jgi:hypothetical protein
MGFFPDGGGISRTKDMSSRIIGHLMRIYYLTESSNSHIRADIYAISGPSSPSREPVNNAPVDLLSVHFTGRGEELDFLKAALSKSHNGSPSRCAVHGMPGLGKTQLLLRYAKLSFDRHQYIRVFWISATSVDKLNQGFAGILDLIKHPDRFLEDQYAKLTSARLWLPRNCISER